MYINWAESHQIEHDILKNFRFKNRHNQFCDETCSAFRAIVKFSGACAYGLLKHEIGIHHLLPTNQLATITIYPEVIFDYEKLNHDNFSIDIVPHTFRYQSSMVHRTNSHIKVTHLPTGIETDADCERSQHKNKDNALKALMSKLYYHAELVQSIELIRIYNAEHDIAKSANSDIQCNFQSTLNGNIDSFIKAHHNLAL